MLLVRRKLLQMSCDLREKNILFLELGLILDVRLGRCFLGFLLLGLLLLMLKLRILLGIFACCGRERWRWLGLGKGGLGVLLLLL